jgi:hypothetical protein
MWHSRQLPLWHSDSLSVQLSNWVPPPIMLHGWLQPQLLGHRQTWLLASVALAQGSSWGIAGNAELGTAISMAGTASSCAMLLPADNTAASLSALLWQQ